MPFGRLQQLSRRRQEYAYAKAARFQPNDHGACDKTIPGLLQFLAEELFGCGVGAYPALPHQE